MVRTLCEDLKYRVDAVDVAIKAGIHKRPQPDQLPNNIYGTDGDWETYSTPSRDARLKTAFKELRDEVGPLPGAGCRGQQPAGLRRRRHSPRHPRRPICRRRAPAPSPMPGATAARSSSTFAEVARRLFALSFDPHHCAERRWGAQDAEELATCPDGADKRAWYDAEQRLRNQPDRTYDVRMGFSLADLRKAVPGSGIDAPPGIDVLALLGDAPATGNARAASKIYEPAAEPKALAEPRPFCLGNVRRGKRAASVRRLFPQQFGQMICTVPSPYAGHASGMGRRRSWSQR